MTSSSPDLDPRAVDIRVDDDELTVEFVDGRRLSVSLAWFPRLLHAEPAQRRNWRLIGDGAGVHWPELDEDVSIRGLLRGSGTTGASNGSK